MSKSISCGKGTKQRRLVSISRYAIILLIVGGSLSWLSTARAQTKVVRVVNQMNTPIWVMIAENQEHIIETKTKTIGEVDFEAYYKIIISGGAKVPIEGVPVDASYKTESEFKTKLKKYWEENKEEKFEWSGFIKSGELKIDKGSSNKFSLKSDEKIYYISIRAIDGQIVADAVQRSEQTITIDENGSIVDENLEEIKNGMTVYLKSNKKYIGNPRQGNNYLYAVTVGDSKGPYRFENTSGGQLKANVWIKIYSKDNTLKDKDGMYSTEAGNVYIGTGGTTGENSNKRQWKVSKTNNSDNSPDNKLHYGDEVIISNRYWQKANLGINGEWAQCVNNDKTKWTLTK